MNDTAESGLAIRIHHTMLPVADIDKSIKFYTTLLGMNLRFRRKSEARMTEQAHIGYGAGAVRSSIELTQDIGERAPETGNADERPHRNRRHRHPSALFDLGAGRRNVSASSDAKQQTRRETSRRTSLIRTGMMSNSSSDTTIEGCFLGIETAC